MLVHLGEGYFVEKDSIVCIEPWKDEEVIGISFCNERHLSIPYRLLENLIAELDK